MENLKVLRCSSCGSNHLKKINTYLYKCLSCGSIYEDRDIVNEEEILLTKSYDTLRIGDFDESEECFDEIIKKFPESYRAYWGKMLAKNGIIFVDDMLENKMVPTCSRINGIEILDSAEYKNAYKFALTEVKKIYEIQANRINQIRREWLLKAVNEPSYDIFLCFKDSDEESGTLRTPDSFRAEELYKKLIANGFKVFFSRESLKNKVSENYEPYIYNALSTSKLMIVLGTKPHYFQSTWVKNEWRRFAKKIENGEKAKNSLIVVYQNFNASDLPAGLRTMQALNLADETFFNDLMSHINKLLRRNDSDFQNLLDAKAEYNPMTIAFNFIDKHKFSRHEKEVEKNLTCPKPKPSVGCQEKVITFLVLLGIAAVLTIFGLAYA